MKIKNFIYFLVLLLSCNICFCQENVSGISYNTALDLYNQGKYEEALALMNSGNLKRGTLTKSQYENVLILLTQIYIEMKDFSNANKTLILVYKNNRNYKPIPGFYQEDFYAYSNRIVVHPQFSIGTRGEVVIPHFKNYQTYSVPGDIAYEDYSFESSLGIANFLEYNFKKKLAVQLSYGIQSFSFYRKSPIYTISEGNKYYDIELDFKNYLSNSSFIRPYYSLGLYLSHTYREENYINSLGYDLNYQNKTNFFTTNRIGADLTLGISFGRGRFLVSTEGKYMYDFSKMNNSSDKFNANYYDKLYYQEDIYLRRYVISISVATIINYSFKTKLK